MPSRSDDTTQSRPPIPDVRTSQLPDSPTASPSLQAADDAPPTWESFRAFCSANQRAGRWEPAEEIDVRAIAGEVTLDFTLAELPPSGMIEIDAWAICGEINIIVPDGAEIELDGTPVFGSIEQKPRRTGAREWIRERVTGERSRDLQAPPPASEPPFFRIDGHAIFGAIKVMGR